MYAFSNYARVGVGCGEKPMPKRVIWGCGCGVKYVPRWSYGDAPSWTSASWVVCLVLGACTVVPSLEADEAGMSLSALGMLCL